MLGAQRVGTGRRNVILPIERISGFAMKLLQRQLVTSVAAGLALDFVKTLDEMPANGLVTAPAFGTGGSVLPTFCIKHEALLTGGYQASLGSVSHESPASNDIHRTPFVRGACTLDAAGASPVPCRHGR